MKSKFLLKILLPIFLFAFGSKAFAQSIIISAVSGSLNTVYSTTPTIGTFTVGNNGFATVTNIAITAPAGYEISSAALTGFTTTLNINSHLGPGFATEQFWIRLIPLTGVANSPVSAANITATSTSPVVVQTGSTGGPYTISPVPISISVPTIAPKVYDGTTTPGLYTPGYINFLVGGETLTVTASLAPYSSANVGNYTTDISYTVTDGTGLASNYSALPPSLGIPGSITIKPISISGTTIAPKVYDGTNAIGVINFGTITGLVGGETLTLTDGVFFGNTFSGANVGTYNVSILPYKISNGSGGGLASNYSYLSPSFDVPGSIIPKPITISAPTIAPKVYNGTTAAGVITLGTVAGLVGIETLTVTSSATAYSSANVGAAHTSNVSYTIAGGTGLATNYSALAPNNLTGLSITPAPITISAPTIAPKVYNGTTAAGVITLGTVAGLVGIEKLTVTSSATAYSSANVGAAYTSTVSYVVTNGVGGLAANYSTLASNNLVALSITPAPLTITANAVNKYHGDVLASPVVGSTAFSTTGLVAPESIGSVTITYGASALAPAPLGANAGHVVPSAATGGTFTASNYTITYAPGTLTVIPNTNAYLSNLVSSTGALNTAFDRNDIDYETYVLIAVNSLTVTPTTENQFATVRVRINNTGFSPEPYAPVLSGVASPVMTLQEGVNMIDITVTAEDGVTIINYRIKVSREVSWVSGGGGGGLESRSLGDAVAKRIFNKAINSENGPVDYNKMPQVQFRYVQNRVQGIEPSKVSLTSIMPDITSKGYVAYNSSPKDLTSITNAKEVLAFDFTANKEVKAVAFATKTLGELYDHTKPICDRLKGASLVSVENMNISGFDLVKYTLNNEKGQREYATSFSIGSKSGRADFSIQSTWLTKDYIGDETMYNFQLWAATPELVKSMVMDIFAKLNSVASIKAISNVNIPSMFVLSGIRERTNLNLVLTNTTNSNTGYFILEDKNNEASTTINTRTIPFTLSANGKTNITIPMSDIYESTISMYVNGVLKDVVYMSDGTWYADYNKATTVVNSFTVSNDPNRNISADEFPLLRKVSLKANSPDYISIVKLMKGGGMEADLSLYKGLKFTASGGQSMHITLVKNSIVNWKEQYYADINLDQDQKDYFIGLDKFKSDVSSNKLVANDISSIAMSVIVSSGRQTAINTDLSNVSFTKEDLSYINSIDSKDIQVFPNPANAGKFSCTFYSNKDIELTLHVNDVTGRLVGSKQILATKGFNKVSMEVVNATTGTHIVSLEGASVKYNSKKVVLTY